ncbi:hypothetical protein HS141_13730 [Cetobacterium somerae]|uniref:hypothetical protein n=1 Tax=Cetobacterium somerae TaxID=188913 RepID=UPI00211F39E7|nr:hypothetical protein [Cetobacterium somerae]MCQ9627988.1 hypothetical protein [Cetobacterium somerae]
MHFFHEKLAAKIGLYESIFLQNIYYLAKVNLVKKRNENTLDIWICLSSSTIEKYQPYFTRSKIRTLTKNLIEMDLLKKCKRNSNGDNTFSYALTDRGWMLMLSLESKPNLKKFQSSLVQFDQHQWLNIINLWLNAAKPWLNSPDPWLILTKPMQDLANIIIEYRNIENNRNIEKMDSENFEKKADDYEDYFFEIENMISQNYILKKRIEKTFEDVNNYINLIINPAVRKFGALNVVEAFKKTVSDFLPSYSPVFFLYKNLDKLNER